MIPRTFPSSVAFNGSTQMIVYFLPSVTGLTRWVDYIPVKFTTASSALTENTYNQDGYIPVLSIPSIAGLTPFKEYVPVFLDNFATDADVWGVNITGFIPVGTAGVGGASLYIDFAASTSIDPRITFTRASTATRFNASGVLTSEAINAPRFDYDPVTLAPKGLLIEESRTNLVTYSEQFDDAAWTKTRSSITANAIVSPDGTMDADKLVEDSTAANTHQIQRSISYTSGTTYTRSLYAKAAERTGFRFQFPSSAFTSGINAYFDLATGTVASVSAGVTATITPVGNGWYRCTATATATATASGTEISCGLTITASNPTYTGDGTSGLFIWGAQLEAGAFATSYIPTVASQVTRAADNAVMTGTNFSSWYNATEGTLFGDYQSSAGTNQRAFSVSDGTSTNVMNILVTNASGNGSSFAVTVSGTLVAGVPANIVTQSATNYKVAGAYQNNNVNGARNGTIGTTDTSAAIPTVDRAVIGAGGSSTQFLNGTIRRIAYYSRRLSDAELQGITS